MLAAILQASKDTLLSSKDTMDEFENGAVALRFLLLSPRNQGE
jgi:hypothetical protein